MVIYVRLMNSKKICCQVYIIKLYIKVQRLADKLYIDF